MKNTRFLDCTGLTVKVIIAVHMMLPLCLGNGYKAPMILEFTSVWMDSFRGEFELTNTNKLVRFYNGADGLKTGLQGRDIVCLPLPQEII